MRKEQVIYRYAMAFVYPVAAIAFFLGFQAFASDLMDFTHLAYLGPNYLSYMLIPTYVVIFLYFLSFPSSEKNLKRTFVGNGIALATIGLIDILWVAINYGTGTYYAFIQGGTTGIFPFDQILIGLAGALLGGLSILRWKLLPLDGFSYLPYRHSAYRRIVSSVFRPLYLFIALYMFGGLLLGFSFANYDSPYFPYMFPLYLLMALQTAFLGFYVFLYKTPLLEGKAPKNDKLAYAASVSSISLGIVLLIVMSICPDFVVKAGKPYFPLDFMGSLNVAPLLTAFPPLIWGTVYGAERLILFLRRKKR